VLTSELWTAAGLALGALLLVSVLLALAPRLKSLPMLVPMGAGYLLGDGGFGLLHGELASRTALFALEIGAGWIAFDATSSALATMKRAPTRSAVYWAIAYALVGPSILVAGLSPLAASVIGAGGLALHAMAVAGVAGALPDAGVFKSPLLGDKVSSDKIREAVRTSDALQTAVLLALPIYWGAARSMAHGEWFLVDSVLASVGASFALGLTLGLAAYVVVKYLKWSLALAALMTILTIVAAALGEQFQISAVATCFIAGVMIGQNAQQRKMFTDVAHNLRRPFMLVMLLAAGAVAPAWHGFLPGLLILAVILAGRFAIGKIADTLASTSPNVGAGRQFAWLVAVPSALSVAIAAEGLTILGSFVDANLAANAGALPAKLSEFTLPPISEQTGVLSLLAPFLLAIGLADIFGRKLLASGYPKAVLKAKKAAAAVHAASPGQHRKHRSRPRSHKA